MYFGCLCFILLSIYTETWYLKCLKWKTHQFKPQVPQNHLTVNPKHILLTSASAVPPHIINGSNVSPAQEAHRETLTLYDSSGEKVFLSLFVICDKSKEAVRITQLAQGATDASWMFLLGFISSVCWFSMQCHLLKFPLAVRNKGRIDVSEVKEQLGN